MISRRLIVSACAAAMFATVNVPAASAQISWVLDSKTEFAFNNPVEMPGTRLPPGTYVFKFADSTTSKTVMQVVDKATNKTYGMFMTISAQRPKASDAAELRFMETPAGKPAAVATWWYPGNTIGREFIYPKSQARRLAQATNTTVLTTKTDADVTEKTQSADLEYVSPSGQESAVSEQASTTATVQSSTTSSASNSNIDRTPLQESTSASNSSRRSQLPHTSSLLPLFGLLGASSFAGGLSMSFHRR